jgi:ABC-type polysaccharide/polyol phosphate export permease
MLGQLSWTLFASSAAMSTGAIVDNAGLLKSVHFPRAILPIGTVLFNLAQYLLTVSVFLPAMLIWYQVPLSPPMLLFPVFLALQVLLTIGVALILATWTAFFRMFATCSRSPRDAVLDDADHLRAATGSRAVPAADPAQPGSPFVVAYQQIFFYREWPDPTVWLVAAAHGFGAFILGSLLFLAFEDGFTEQL